MIHKQIQIFLNMKDSKDNLNDTKYLLEETEYKNINNGDESNFKNTILNNTQLLLEDKSSILCDISFENININSKPVKNGQMNKLTEKEQKNELDNSIKDILIKNININTREENEKLKDEKEIIKQQNILLNNQSSHLEELLSLSYNDIPHNKNKNIKNISNNKNKQIYFGVLFPTEKIIKTINYKNDDKKKIICFNIVKSENSTNNDEQYFKLLIDKNKNYFNLKANEEINIKILLQAPFIKRKKKLSCDIQIMDINNCLIETLNIFANIEIPKLCCMKYIKNNIALKECNIPLIQIKLNLDSNNKNNIHKFRIPMKNLSIKDLNINFFFISNPKEENIKDNIDYEIFFENDKMVNIPSLDVNYCEILVNIKNKGDIYNILKNLKIKKILGVNIADTTINYYFCFEIVIIYNNKDINDI